MHTPPPMQRALDLARSGQNHCHPNPSVGCVIVNDDGLVIGEGNTQKVGGPHAEIVAMRSALAHGHSLNNATAYVTLEPCAHRGRTGPCCEALIQAGVAKVVASIADPNPLVAGKGFDRLRAAGIDVEIGPGAAEAREINIGFFSRMVRGTPWVRMKIAASLDGTTALRNGSSQWITSPEARADGQAWRARAGAVLTGIGTVLADDPQLNVRLPHIQRQPDLVIVDGRMRTPLNASLWGHDRRTFLYTATDLLPMREALSAQGAKVTYMPRHDGDSSGGVDLESMMCDLARQEINEVHVEAGHTLNGALLSNHLVDEVLVYLAPTLLGGGRGMSLLPALSSLGEAIAMTYQSVERIGPDLRVVARIKNRDLF